VDCPELAGRAAARGITPAVSASTVRRWLGADAIKPWWLEGFRPAQGGYEAAQRRIAAGPPA
jgi:hypothetical protein